MEAKMLLLCLLSFGQVGSIKPISFVNISLPCDYNNLFISYKILHMAQFSDSMLKVYENS